MLVLLSASALPHYPPEALYEEIAYVAYHFHWSQAEIMDMEHAERHRWVKEISKINRRLTGSGSDD